MMKSLAKRASLCTEVEVEDLKASYGITDETLAEVRNLGTKIIPNMENVIDQFYKQLAKTPYWDTFLSDQTVVSRLKNLQASYWRDFFSIEVLDQKYVDSRRHIGAVHAKVGLPLSAYFTGMVSFLRIFSEYITQIDDYICITKLAHLDLSQTVESYSTITNQTISEQTRIMTEMSTPITAIWDGVLMLPICGIIDSARAQGLMTSILSKINDTQSKIIIMDIAGVPVVDTAVANHIIQITKAAKLMGCQCLVSGVSPAIAQTIVELGIDVNSIQTTATLKDSLRFALKKIGVTIHDKKQEVAL